MDECAGGCWYWERERRREGGREKKRDEGERQIAGYLFMVFKSRERKRPLVLFVLFSPSVFLSSSLFLSLIYPIVSPLLKWQKFLIELLFFAGDFLELQKEKKKKEKQFFLRRHSTLPTCIPLLYREFFDDNVTRGIASFSHDCPSSIEYRSNTTIPFSRLIHPRNRPPYSFLWFLLPIAFFS